MVRTQAADPPKATTGLEPMQASWQPMHSTAWTGRYLSLDNATKGSRQPRKAQNPYRYKDGSLRPDRPPCFVGIEYPSPRAQAYEAGLRDHEVGRLVPNYGLPEAGGPPSPCAAASPALVGETALTQSAVTMHAPATQQGAPSPAGSSFDGAAGPGAPPVALQPVSACCG